MGLITGSLCLSKIPKDKIKEGKDGNMYLNICIADRREPDTYGNTHAIYVSQDKEEREAKADKCYIGSGKLYEPNPAPTAEQIAQMPAMNQAEALPWETGEQFPLPTEEEL